ncbi:FKBP-type peptidyl-prolyl cis-trans isomerase [Leeuwenhoekiella parthenopeia]|uniref:Peptidyl-prolyl cis-trans isomerase n=1 Tax=Leeuwenhoekiella parthenopeia TaxID=2890320 RepID=A0ABS8GQ42_9FLAO|nr:FKBP-type peptidyl-prolyl cis-trans isomerase [Leeuwenhoekiella parthenopeia]MCC4212090.1 FKBP-type peptidyl-prolyl cis-trans isomerase [Leeuwenhoekiella parthenopeia]
MNIKSFVLVSVAALALANCSTPQKTVAQPEKFQLRTFQDSISYAMGISSGENLREMPGGIFNLAVFEKGLKESFKDSLAIELDEAASRKLFQKLNDTMQKIEKIKREEQIAATRAEGTAFLEENAKKPGVVTTESGLQYEVLREGNGEKPGPGDRVKVNYEGKLLDGTVFDSSYKRGEPLVFGVSQVINGWTEGLQLMSIGSKYRFYIPQDLAYGERGAGKDIKPYATLIFDVELLEVLK